MQLNFSILHLLLYWQWMTANRYIQRQHSCRIEGFPKTWDFNCSHQEVQANEDHSTHWHTVQVRRESQPWKAGFWAHSDSTAVALCATQFFSPCPLFKLLRNLCVGGVPGHSHHVQMWTPMPTSLFLLLRCQLVSRASSHAKPASSWTARAAASSAVTPPSQQKQHVPCALSRPKRLGAGKGTGFPIRGYKLGNI